MRPTRNYGLLLIALAPHAVAMAAAPTGGPSLLRPDTTIAQVDQTVESMKRAVWDLTARAGESDSRRGAAEDLNRYVFSDEALRELDALRARLPEAVDPASGRIAASALEQLDRILVREACNISTVTTHWSNTAMVADLRKDMAVGLGRLPDARRRSLDAQIGAISAELRPDSKRLEGDVQQCASLKPGDIPAYASRIDSAMRALDKVRQQLVETYNQGVTSGEIAVLRQARSAPCPPARQPTPGQARPQLESKGNDGDVYPPLARNLGIEGVVRLKVDVDAGGCVTATAVVETSGSDMLDQAARGKVEQYEFIPAEVDGKPASYTFVQRLSFSLRER